MDTNFSQTGAPKSSKFLKWILVLGITIVLNLFFNYSIQVFYKEPKWENFCKQEQVNIVPETKDKCVAEGGQWNETPYYNDGRSPVAVDINGKTKSGYCNTTFTCQKEYDDVHKVYNRNIFIGLVVLGIISIVGSFVIASYEAVSLGLSLGGIVSLVIASVRYWSDMDDRVRVVVLGIALVLLVYMGIKKFKD